MVAILTGTTDVNTLSASCDKANSLITTSLTPAGWTLHDDAAGTNTKVIKAPIADNPSQFKYQYLSTNNVGYFENRLYETWNATTHVGTNMASNDSSYSSYAQRVSFSFASGGFLYLSSSARHLVIHSMSSGSTFGAAANNNGCSGCVEYTRWSPWDTVSNGYMPVASINPGAFLYTGGLSNIPRLRTTSGTDNGASAYTYPLTNSLPSSKISDAAGSLIIPLMPIIISGTSNSNWFLGGNVSELTNIWYGPISYGSMLDEFTLGSGTTYVIFTASTTRVAIPKG